MPVATSAPSRLGPSDVPSHLFMRFSVYCQKKGLSNVAASCTTNGHLLAPAMIATRPATEINAQLMKFKRQHHANSRFGVTLAPVSCRSFPAS
jgi:hypothetical protein